VWIRFGEKVISAAQKAVQCKELRHIPRWSAKVWFLRDVRVDATPEYDGLWGLEVREQGDVHS